MTDQELIECEWNRVAWSRCFCALISTYGLRARPDFATHRLPVEAGARRQGTSTADNKTTSRLYGGVMDFTVFALLRAKE